MNEPTMENMVQRLDRFERENRRLKYIGALVVLGIAAVVLMGQAKSSKVTKVIEAEKFVLRDSSGSERALLSSKDAVFLTLFDRNGKIRASINETSLAIADKNGKVRIGLVVSDEGNPIVVLQNEAGKERASLYLRSDGSPGLVLRDEAMKPRAALYLSSDALPGLWLYDKDEKWRTRLELTDDGDAGLALTDKYGSVRAALGLVKGRPVIVFTDENGKDIWSAK